MRKVKFKAVGIGFRGRRYSAFAQGKYSLEFPKGVIVQGVKGTLGVSVFKTRKQAELFQEDHSFLEIIRVRPIGRGRNVKLICSDPSEYNLFIFYREEKLTTVIESRVPLGTIFYPAVEVLD